MVILAEHGHPRFEAQSPVRKAGKKIRIVPAILFADLGQIVDRSQRARDPLVILSACLVLAGRFLGRGPYIVRLQPIQQVIPAIQRTHVTTKELVGRHSKQVTI